jgi:hypothetical protein
MLPRFAGAKLQLFCETAKFLWKIFTSHAFFHAFEHVFAGNEGCFQDFRASDEPFLPRTFTDRLGLYALARVLLIGICNPDALSISI